MFFNFNVRFISTLSLVNWDTDKLDEKRDTVDSIFSIGIQSLWDELSHMPVGGVWWINTDRNEDAISLVNQTIAAQDKDSRVAVISMGEDPKKIITLENDRGPPDGAIIFHDIGSR